MRPGIRFWSLAGIVALLIAAGCSGDRFAANVALIRVVPQPTAGQTSLQEPVGLNLGPVPLFGQEIGTFGIESAAQTRLEIRSIEAQTLLGARVTSRLYVNDVQIVIWPAEIRLGDTARLEVDFSPEGGPDEDGNPIHANLVLQTNAGESRDLAVPVQIHASAWFLGEPGLSLKYGGFEYAVPRDCAAGQIDGLPGCTLPALDFGNVPFSTLASEIVTVLNVPAEDTCRLPDLGSGQPDCQIACAVTIAPDTERLGMGVGFVPPDLGFDGSGVSTENLPLVLAPSHPACDGLDPPQVARGEQRFLINYRAGSEEVDAQAQLVLESDTPGAPLVTVPLLASPRQAPVAQARLRTCDAENPLPQCSLPDTLQPLGRAFLDGRNSFDPRDPNDPSLITAYRWEVIDAPAGSDPGSFDLQGADSPLFDLFLPLAGDYRIRLHVTNDIGIESGISSTSDVLVTALPQSRVHVQLVWDHPTNDQDLHLVYGEGSGLVYKQEDDCFWLQCHVDCENQATPCDPPLQWFSDEPPFADGNPRLDIDDTNGLGPENINIDRPRPGTYRIFVHYYGLTDPIDDPTRATVRVFVDGVLRGEFSRTLSRNDLWAVAQITWGEDDSALITSAVPDAVGAVGTVQELNGNYYPEGFDFGPVFDQP